MAELEKVNHLIENPTEYYQDLFAKADPEEMSKRTGVPFDGEKFNLRVLNLDLTLSWPSADDECIKPKDRILFMRYLLEGKAVPFTTEFASYKDLPWGEVYNKPFTGRCIYRMLGSYGNNSEAFIKACDAYGGVRVKSSGIAYEFEFMHNLFLRFILWEGDDEFPANMQILFSKNFADTFSGEDRVVVCEYLIGKMQSLR